MTLDAITGPVYAAKKTLAIIAAAICVCALVAGLGARTAWVVQQNKLDALVASHAAAEAKRETAIVTAAAAARKKQDEITLHSAVAEASAQTRIITRYTDRIKEVPTYVTVQQDAVGCVTFGFVRVLDAAAGGQDPADLELPAGQSDDACTALAPSAVAAGILDNYRIADQNAQQLDALIADIRARITAANGVEPDQPLPRPDVPRPVDLGAGP